MDKLCTKIDLMEAEDRIQTQCYIYFHNNYPEFRGLLCYNHNNPKNRIDGSKQKGLGLQPGRSDLVAYFDGSAYMIEMKTPDGSQQKNQKDWQKQIEKQGFNYFICRSLEDFKQIIHGIFGVPIK